MKKTNGLKKEHCVNIKENEKKWQKTMNRKSNNEKTCCPLLICDHNVLIYKGKLGN